MPLMGSRHRHRDRRSKTLDYGEGAIKIRVGSRRSSARYRELLVSSSRDASRFTRLIEDQVHDTPRGPVIIAINGYQPWLEEVLECCVDNDEWDDMAELDREVQFAGTMQFPERASKRGQDVPWTFIIDQMNMPQVYYWSVGLEDPRQDQIGLPEIETYRFRIGVWQRARGACAMNRNVPVILIFTRPTVVSEHVVTRLLFDAMYKDIDRTQPRANDEGICWTFMRLYWLLTDWQNIIFAITARLEEADANSHVRNFPVKWRTRMLHNEVDRLYELKEYLQFHTRSFKKLQKLKDAVSKPEQQDPLWDDMDDAVEDLGQYDSSIDGLKERFNNLIELEFNIQNAVQSDNSQFLSTIATLFLPVSFLASVFGITTITWPPIWYLYAAVPTLVVSVIFTLAFSRVVRMIQRRLFPVEQYRMRFSPHNFTMLGDELPDSADIPGGQRARLKNKAHRPAAGMDNGRSRSRSRSKRRIYDGDDG